MSALRNDEVRDLYADADRADDHFATMAEYERRARARKEDADRRLREAAQTPLWRGGVEQAGLWLVQRPEEIRGAIGGFGDALTEAGSHLWAITVAALVLALHLVFALLLIVAFPLAALLAGWRVRVNARAAIARIDATAPNDARSREVD